MSGLRVKLTREELSECQQAASLRWQLARASGVGNQRKDGTRDDADVDLLGIKGEYAVAKLFDLNFNPFSLGIDEGCDMFADDLGIDVKTSFHRSGRLAFKTVKAFKAEVSVLATASEREDTMLIAGWITQTRFREECEITDFGSGKAATVDQERLAAPEKLWRLIQNRRSL